MCKDNCLWNAMNSIIKNLFDYKCTACLLWKFWKEPKSSKIKLLYSCYFRVYIIFLSFKKIFCFCSRVEYLFSICPIKNFLWHHYNCSLIWYIYVCTLVLLVSMTQFIMICDHRFRDTILQKQPFFYYYYYFFWQGKNSRSTESLLSRFRFGLCYIYVHPPE